MRRLLFLAALLGSVALTSGCEEKKTTAASSGSGGGPMVAPGSAPPVPK